MRAGRAGELVVLASALASRLAVAAWAGASFPAAADGHYYDVLARRLAAGQGYTWAWPDGVVTFAAHYPVGYPWLLSLAYRLLGASPVVAGALNAVIGIAAALAGLGLARRAMGERAAVAFAVIAAVDPALLLYQPAVMTEAVTAHLLVVAAYVASRAHDASSRGERAGAWLGALGALLGLAVLVRPQCLLVAPLFGALAVRARLPGRLAAGAIVTACALVICAPWTARNCVRMKHCSLVSVNGGWNLLIGAGPGATGHWTPVPVPDACKTVYDEAQKDVCFGREARGMIAAEPLRWLSLVPKKLRATFDYAGAAPWYLSTSNGARVTEAGKRALGGVETLFHRVLLGAALLGLGLAPGPRRAGRAAIAALAAALLAYGIVTTSAAEAWVAHLALPVIVLLFGRAALRLPVLVLAAASVLVATAVTHAVFFGAGRYGLVVFPLVTLCAGLCAAASSARPPGALLTRSPAGRDT